MKYIFFVLVSIPFTTFAQIPVYNLSGFDMEVTVNNQTHYLKVNEMIQMPKNTEMEMEWKFLTDFELKYDSIPSMILPLRMEQNKFKATIILQTGKFSFKRPKIIRA